MSPCVRSSLTGSRCVPMESAITTTRESPRDSCSATSGYEVGNTQGEPRGRPYFLFERHTTGKLGPPGTREDLHCGRLIAYLRKDSHGSAPEPFCLDLRRAHVLSTFFLTFLPAGLNIFATWLGPRILSPRLLVAALGSNSEVLLYLQADL